MDLISLHHPAIQREFQLSLLDAFPNTIVAKVAPISSAFQFVMQMVIIIQRHIDIEFTKRYRLEKDPKCKEFCKAFDFEVWLKDQASKLLPPEERPKGDIRDYAFR